MDELVCELCDGPCDNERWECPRCQRMACYVCAGDVHNLGQCTECDNDDLAIMEEETEGE